MLAQLLVQGLKPPSLLPLRCRGWTVCGKSL